MCNCRCDVDLRTKLQLRDKAEQCRVAIDIASFPQDGVVSFKANLPRSAKPSQPVAIYIYCKEHTALIISLALSPPFPNIMMWHTCVCVYICNFVTG